MISFRELDTEDADMILKWRSAPRVNRFMVSDISIDVDAQKQWIESCYNKPSYYHWIIQLDGKDVGLLNFSNWDQQDNTTSWGFYIGHEDALGIGGFIPPYFYNFAFNKLSVNLIKAEVFYSNINTIQLHLKHGYQFAPSRDEVVIKAGKDVLLIAMELDKANFNHVRFKENTANFETSKWNAAPVDWK